MIKMIFFVLSLMISCCLNAEALYPFNSVKKEAQFQNLLKNLRCLVCQNQDLVDSNAPLAKDLRQVLYQQVSDGWTDQQIIQYLTDRYGDFILFNPPLKSITYFLWGFPMMCLLGGVGLFLHRVRRDDR